jgi:uncharacterized cupin superfamily protein
MDKYVVSADEITAMPGLEKTHFLNPNAKRINKSLGELTGLKAIGFHTIEVEPGHETTEPHVHHHEDECVYVLEGQAQASIGAEVITVTAGDFIGYRAGGEPHALRNTGDTLLRCIVVGQRLTGDVADYPCLGKRLFRAPGLQWNLVDVDNISEPQAGRKA